MTSTLTHIRLELAREPGAPAGNPQYGWDIVAVLDADGRLDAAGCRAEAERLHVRRFEDNQTIATGTLRQGPGGKWLLDLEPEDAPDATGFRFGEERFVAGEYVSLTDADGDSHTYVVAKAAPL
ncbi:MAG: hypothetical protein Q8R97_14440 [Brevundimonas sp.]|uniref:hypothetical protein n=1 Tax=Brevundimonas sp. TaxID=1871086 RepID=UPI0027443288|nr:hypothetical protein [Brevundimonas sp.]MDP3402305.1 hypothetical protein [Brevundimonas sp.]MDZ4108248.1 hypothetical protein [Brevundimonas sp.]